MAFSHALVLAGLDSAEAHGKAGADGLKEDRRTEIAPEPDCTPEYEQRNRAGEHKGPRLEASSGSFARRHLVKAKEISVRRHIQYFAAAIIFSFKKYVLAEVGKDQLRQSMT